jgi:uncharacterized surface protein with fasciclin (FAS1) repeats
MLKTTVAFLLTTLSSGATLKDIIREDPRLSEFHYTLSETNVDLSGDGPFTVFAPMNGAFVNSGGLSPSKFKNVRNDETKLQKLIKFHVSKGKAMKSEQLPSSIPTMAGQSLNVDASERGIVKITDSACGLGNIVEHNIVADNGMLHIVDSAFVPSGTFCPDTVFATEGSKYQRYVTAYGYDCRSSGSTNLANEKATKPVAVATSESLKSVFWTDDMDYPHGSATSWSSSVKYDGSGKHHVVDNIVDPQGIATDDTNKKLYFATHSGNSIIRTNYDGSGKETMVVKLNNESFQPSGVGVDATAGLVFASIEQPNSTGYVAMFDLKNDFSEQMLAGPKIVNPCKHFLVLFFFSSFFFFQLTFRRIIHYAFFFSLDGLCVDDVAKHVYYIVGGHGGQIRCVNYGSTPCKSPVLLDVVDYAYNCAVDNSMANSGGPTNIVFSDADDIYFVSSEGGDYQKLNRTNVTDPLQSPMGVAFGCRSN